MPRNAARALSTVHLIDCPVCDIVDKRLALADGMVVDVCDDHGVWFDANELEGTEFVARQLPTSKGSSGQSTLEPLVEGPTKHTNVKWRASAQATPAARSPRRREILAGRTCASTVMRQQLRKSLGAIRRSHFR